MHPQPPYLLVWSVEPVFEDQRQSEAEFYIVVVFDQAIYAKAIEIKWKHDERFRHIVIKKMGGSI